MFDCADCGVDLAKESAVPPIHMEATEEGAIGVVEISRLATKRKRKPSKLRRRPAGSLFPLTLAALNHPRHPSSTPLIKACLNRVLHILFPKSPDSPSSFPDDQLLGSVLALLPLLLESRSSEIVCASLKILGAASLISYEVNEKIALEEGETLRRVLPKVLSGSEKVAMAACNVVLDVSSTSLGRQQLIDLSATNYLMLGFLQVMKSPKCLASLCILEKEGISCLGVQQVDDELPILNLSATVSLINFCNGEQLDRIPRKLMDMSIIYMKILWSQLREQILCRKNRDVIKCSVNNLTTSSMAETIFRLSLNASHFASGFTFDTMMKHMVGAEKSSFQNFMSNYWESSPFITRNSDMDLYQFHSIFDQCSDSRNPEGAFSSFLSSMLKGMVSCVPLGLDETDIYRFLEEAKSLAFPIVDQQDIRVVRTEPNLNCEEHFFAVTPNNCVKLPNSFTMDDILRCEEAYKEGYTIALRGMEFRLKNIAAISDKVASFFGQPSVGANMYLTPPNSQGLACHYDDHCVFVFQLHGTKMWTVSRQPLVELPRLYDCLEHPPDLVEGNSQFLLREGDVLYIPRGFPHKACTLPTTDEDKNVADFSLHLTIAVEIAPPFEWEGFIHVALLHWSHCTKLSYTSHSCLSEDFDALSVSLLHVAIRLISNSESVFRKACLVAAVSLPSDIGDWLDRNQRSIFDQLIDIINKLASFSDALEHIKVSIQTNEDPFQWLRWFHALDAEEMVRCGFDLPVEDTETLMNLIGRHKENLETKFVHAKARFCREMVFDDAKERFKMIHAMFKKVRTQYMNGMLSLHY